MKTIRNFMMILSVILVFTALNGCQKEEVTIEDELQLTNQETVAEEMMLDIDVLVDEAIDFRFNPLKSGAIGNAFYLNGCPSIKVDSTKTLKIMTIDFGSSCTGKDGKVRSGKIIVTSTSFVNNTRERVKTFDNFFVEGRKVEGTISKTVTVNRADHSMLARNKEDVTITFPENKGKVIRVADMTRDYHLNILNFERDNTVTSWGEVRFTRANGLKITKVINEDTPLLFKLACRQVVSGIITFTTSDNRTWTIDFGDGSCDRKATITRNGESKTFPLR